MLNSGLNKFLFVTVTVIVVSRQISGKPYGQGPNIFPFNPNDQREMEMKSVFIKPPITGFPPLNTRYIQDKLRSFNPQSFVKFDFDVSNKLPHLHVLGNHFKHPHAHRPTQRDETVLNANRFEYKDSNSENADLRKADTSTIEQGTKPLTKIDKLTANANTKIDLSRTPEFRSAENPTVSQTAHTTEINKVIEINKNDNEFGIIFLDDTIDSNPEKSTQETTTDFTTEPYETTTFEDDNLNRMGVPAGVVASLLG